ncbi:glutamine--fructose-6-phosphate transaminase (isomerizing) [Bradymonadaceae bacterium TMQ3]|uniref:Glutamine--fructose-6-phosphate aminotransferase [isomerizing] n=1 Tax=Lujinxingia sediminis TaxID=2480984 RepID=A0ABY0CVU0_9DELT|nr:glutamine--fructose-6-phosphate transaminase (isomerizing) [Lujinxingia sediminis]RDV36584.1 glutamine--fructose-6-phosphate transaminase (isomerizing) [Bradymonadaceae bacterium TMQ3]RVU47023.1 glutamine--fructose-6-phosphate transaminase (isomerizing) [Lujinxingia sediminis]TXC68634.1 glutamine--fructose-6-phosphate transaminase (isomerizing) [Bradymonadales bacterium TMQ1]
MCGIVGYVGEQTCSDILLSGLRKLEYRGYDSAGIAIADDEGQVQICRAEGKLARLEAAYHREPFDGSIGLGHTRWATHGRPTELNAHPHRAGQVVVAHNGIIENYLELKDELRARGREFSSETDTEVVAHLIDDALEQGATSLHQATCQALERIEGSYALLVMLSEKPEELVVARFASPMVVARGSSGAFAASDVPAVLSHTRDFIFLEDGDTAVLSRQGIEIFDAACAPVERPVKTISWDPISAEKQGYKHFMLKEIFEQPARIIDTLRGRVSVERGEVNLPELALDEDAVKAIDKIVFVACGTSYFAAQVGRYMIEQHARIPVEVELASEFRYRDPIVSANTVVIGVSQSGETADTLAALREARTLGARTLCVCNVIESTIARESDGVLYTHAGPEIGVASTKAFTTQLAAMGMMAICLGRLRGTLPSGEARKLIEALREVPAEMEVMLRDMAPYEAIARQFSKAHSFLYLGRGNQFPIAAEGALKLKEISYIHAEGYAAGEMKHGPIALIDKQLPVVVLCPRNRVYEKTASNLEEVRARGGRIIAIGDEGDERLEQFADVVIRLPQAAEFVQPLISVVAVQLIAYHIADFKGTDVDQPRNLAKSVTVE